MSVINKIEEIQVCNYSMDKSSILYSIKEGKEVIIYQYPSNVVRAKLNEVQGGIDYFEINGSLCINDIQGATFQILSKKKKYKGEGRLMRYGSENLILHKNDESTLLNNNFEKVLSLQNYPKYYQKHQYGASLFFLVDKLDIDQRKKYRSTLIRYHLREGVVEEIFEATKHKWLNKENIEKDGLICQVIGVHGGNVLLHIAKYQIICIDIKTKEIKWCIEDFVIPGEYKKYLSFGESILSRTPMKWHHIKKENCLYLLARHFCWRIDLNEQKISLVANFLDAPLLERWNFTKTKLFGDQIFFAGAKGVSSTPNKIGVFDIRARQILWTDEVNKGYFKDAPDLMNAHYLVALDSNNMLHIYDSDKKA